jgi:predicted enzyme related to lactoylglutathione lyase
MPRVSHFAIPADVPERAINFYREVFGWQFEVGWEYDTPQGREKYWHVATGDGIAAGINGGLTRREYPGQPISVGIEVAAVDTVTALIENCGGKTLVSKVALPGVAWFAVCQDSEGNSFAIYQPDPTAR